MKRSFVMTMLLGLVAACGDDASGTDGDGGHAAGQGGSEPTDPYAELYECQETAFAEGRALSGPGFDMVTGFVGTPQATYTIHTTQIYVRPEMKGEFYKEAGKVAVQLANTEGLVAFALATDDVCGVARTMGVWTSEEAMYALVGSGAHAEAMQRTTELSFTGRTTSWEATSDEVPLLSWDIARQKLDGLEASGVY